MFPIINAFFNKLTKFRQKFEGNPSIIAPTATNIKLTFAMRFSKGCDREEFSKLITTHALAF